MCTKSKWLDRSTMAMELGERVRQIIRALSKVEAGIQLDEKDKNSLDDALLILRDFESAFEWLHDKNVGGQPKAYSYIIETAPDYWKKSDMESLKKNAYLITGTLKSALKEHKTDEAQLQDALIFFDAVFDTTLEHFGRIPDHLKSTNA